MAISVSKSLGVHTRTNLVLGLFNILFLQSILSSKIGFYAIVNFVFKYACISTHLVLRLLLTIRSLWSDHVHIVITTQSYHHLYTPPPTHTYTYTIHTHTIIHTHRPTIIHTPSYIHIVIPSPYTYYVLQTLWHTNYHHKHIAYTQT